MTRRGFLSLLAAATALVTAQAMMRGNPWRLARRWAIDTGGALWSALRDPHTRLVQHYAPLPLDPAGVDAYLRDYSNYAKRPLQSMAWSDDVYTRYLLSSDYFGDRADTTQPIRYLGFYDPYRAPCTNRLARFDA